MFYKCAYARLIWKANFNLIGKTDLFMCFHIVFQISFQILFQKFYRAKKLQYFEYAVRTIAQYCIYIDSYFLSLIQKWVMYMYLQVRKSADRSLLYRLQIFFYLNVIPFQDYFTHIETSQSVGGAKKIVPQENHLTHPQAERGLCVM